MDDGVRSNVSDGGGFGLTSKAIHAGEHVAMTGRGWQGADKINMDVVESLCDGRESAGRNVSVPWRLDSRCRCESRV